MDAMSISLFRVGALLATFCVLALGACSSKPGLRAPVEDRGRTVQQVPAARPAPAPVPDSSKAAAASAPVPAPAVALAPALDPNAGKPGYYTVKQGDTLIRIGLESGQSHRDIARWNALENPNRIEIGQVLRVVPPEDAKPGAVAKVTSTALPPAGAASVPAKAASAPASASAANTANSTIEDDISFAWPSKGEVLDGFDEAKNKGLDIGGKAGDAVMAAADGQVVYAGSGLRGYGNLLILKHNNTFLTAYAHNQTLLVKEDQKVKKGQKIAEMGSSDSASGVKLHFEIRRQGKPVDPAKLLPAR
jgi:lipoprotein NlpD